jgi:hypothetical protein
MSKVDEIRKKYPEITTATFNRFANGDKTPTKKYLDFMCRAWEDRKVPNSHYRTVGMIVDYANKFEALTPFIVNKDVYSKDYTGNFGNFVKTVRDAEETKEERTFIRQEHANVLIENDQFLFIQPTTHKGSVKYGASTKWCTTGKNDPATFNRYHKNGLLVYLIDKTKTKTENFQKVAFYHEYSNRALNDQITLYAVNDNTYTESHMMTAGWGEDTLLDVFTSFRYYFLKLKEIKKNKDFVDSFVLTLSRLNFDEFAENLQKLEQNTNVSYITNTKEKVEAFLESLNNSKYGIRKTEN